MRVVNADAKSRSTKTPEKCLREAERVEEEDVLGGMPPATSTFFSLFRLRWWATERGGGGCPWKLYPVVSQKIGGSTTLVRADTWRVGSPSLRCGQHTPVHPGVQGDGTRDQRIAPAVAIRRRNQPVQLSAPRYPNTKRSLHPVQTLNTSGADGLIRRSAQKERPIKYMVTDRTQDWPTMAEKEKQGTPAPPPPG